MAKDNTETQAGGQEHAKAKPKATGLPSSTNDDPPAQAEDDVDTTSQLGTGGWPHGASSADNSLELQVARFMLRLGAIEGLKLLLAVQGFNHDQLLEALVPTEDQGRFLRRKLLDSRFLKHYGHALRTSQREKSAGVKLSPPVDGG